MKIFGLVVVCAGFAGTISISSPESQNIRRYFLANYNQFSGNFPLAQEWYDQLFSGNPPLYAYKGYIHFLYDTGNFQRIINLMEQLDEPFSKDAEIQLIFSRALENIGEQEKADTKLVKLANTFKTEQEIIFQVAQLYTRRKEPENALKAIDDLLNNSPRKPNNFIFHFLKAQIYATLNQPENALKNVKLSLEMHQQFDKGWLLFAALQEQLGKLDEAIKGYSSFLQISGNNQEVEQHLLKLIFKQKVMQQKNSLITMNQSCFEKAMGHFNHKEYSQALEQINLCLEQKPLDKESRLLKIQILSAMDNHSQAANDLKTWILQDPTNQLWYSTLHLLCRDGLNHQKAIAVLEDIAQTHPKIILPILYLADMHMREQNNDSALLYHTKALALSKDALLKTKILFHMSLIYYELEQFETMEETLKKGLSLKTNFPPLLNLLAYHYATQGKELAKAQQLMNTVLKKESNNPYFIDTQALIFYKQEKYEKALALLQKALEKAPQNATILRHLGETYYKIGKTDSALTAMKEAQALTTNKHEKAKCTHILNCWNEQS